MSGPAHNIGLARVLDAVALSDAFRRHASYDYPAMVAEVVTDARAVSVLLTWFDTPDNGLIELLRHHVARAAGFAHKLGAEQLILPVDGHRDSLIAQFFRSKVMTPAFAATLPVKVSLQTSEYKRDLSGLGPIDADIKTALDEGVRGMARIKSTLKYQWSAPRTS